MQAAALGLALLTRASVAAADGYDWDIEPKAEPKPVSPPPALPAEPPRRERVSIEIDAPAGVTSELRRGKYVVARCEGRCSVVVANDDYLLDVDGIGISHARHKTRAHDDLHVRITPGSPVEKTIGRTTWIVGGAALLTGLAIAELAEICAPAFVAGDCDPKSQRRVMTVGGLVAGVGVALLTVGLVLDFEGRTGIDVMAGRASPALSWRPVIACAPTRGGAIAAVTIPF